MMKIDLSNVTAHVELSVGVEGSVLAQTILARGEKIEIHYDIESTDEPAKVAGLVRNARNGCYARQTIANPGIFHDTMNLNGKPFSFEDYPAPSR